MFIFKNHKISMPAAIGKYSILCIAHIFYPLAVVRVSLVLAFYFYMDILRPTVHAGRKCKFDL